MVDKRTLANEIDQLHLLETVTKAYGEIAALRMQRTRESVLAVRTFLEEIFEVFYEVRVAFANRERALRGKKANITFLSHNGKQVAVFLSSNGGLFGDIVKKTFDLFIQEARTSGNEITIIGKQGQGLFTSLMPGVPYTYFDLPDFAIKSSDLNPVIRHIVKYDEIHLYYGRFQNVVVQDPIKVTISSKIEIGEQEQGKKARNYLFEPSLEDILLFFENEIFSSVFQQSINESQLAKLASRISAMNQASERIAAERVKLNVATLALSHKLADRKQRNMIPSLLLQF